jgi:hypothetical protein
LINTSFPIVNPRFTTGIREEQKTMVGIGYSDSFASQYVRDLDLAYSQFKQIIKSVVEYFPGTHFVLRPHPFESCKSYEQFITLPNFEVRQEGSSIEWINNAKLLLHLNCITAIEATMLGVEPVSIEWINTSVLASQAPPLNVGYKAQTQEELLRIIEGALNGEVVHCTSEAENARFEVIRERYHAIDGLSAKRVAEAIQGVFRINSKHLKVNRLTFNFKQILREFLGYSIFHMVRRSIEGAKSDKRRGAKSLIIGDIIEKLAKINDAYKESYPVKASYPENYELIKPKLFSHHTIKISRKIDFSREGNDA